MSSHIEIRLTEGDGGLALPKSGFILRAGSGTCSGKFYVATLETSTDWPITEQEYNRLLALLTSPEPEQARVCEWQSEDVASSVWETACDNICDFNGWVYPTPTDNGFRLCPFCGGNLVWKGGEG